MASIAIRPSPVPRVLAVAIAAVLVAGLGALARNPLGETRRDISLTEDHVAAQRSLLDRQVELSRNQLEVTSALLETARAGQAEIAGLVRQQLRVSERGLEILRELERLTRAVLEEVREMNRGGALR